MPDPIGPRMPTPRIVYEEWRRQDGIFSDLAAYKEAPLNEAGVTRPRTISTGFASTNLFSLLGANASIGRLFRPDEEQKGKDRVVVLSDEYFARRFARDPAAVGGSITLGRDDYTVIGVLAGQFRLSGVYEGDSQRKPELWLPLSRLWNRPADHAAFQLFVMAQ